jgi:hypothetical protein
MGYHRMNMVLDSIQMKKAIDWLLTNGSPSVRYLTYKHLVATPTCPEVLPSLWADAEKSACVLEIFGKQGADGSWHAGGSWARSPSYNTVKGGIDPYRPKHVTTVWILPLLGEMDYSATDERIRKACRYTVADGCITQGSE